MSKAIVLIFTLLGISATGFADEVASEVMLREAAGQTSVEFSGRAAEQLMLAIQDSNRAVLETNTICLTRVRLGRISCTLQGSHEGCGRDREFSCTLPAGDETR